MMHTGMILFSLSIIGLMRFEKQKGSRAHGFIQRLVCPPGGCHEPRTFLSFLEETIIGSA